MRPLVELESPGKIFKANIEQIGDKPLLLANVIPQPAISISTTEKVGVEMLRLQLKIIKTKRDLAKEIKADISQVQCYLSIPLGEIWQTAVSALYSENSALALSVLQELSSQFALIFLITTSPHISIPTFNALQSIDTKDKLKKVRNRDEIISHILNS